MKRFALLLILIAGCVQQRPVEPEPDKPKDLPGLAEQAVRDYAAGLSKNYGDAAEHASEFEAHADAVDFVAKKNADARASAFKPMFAEVDKRLLGDPDKPKDFDAAELAKAYREMSTGFGRLSK